MTNPQIIRLMLFALLGLGIALLLCAIVVPDLTHHQAERWLNEPGLSNRTNLREDFLLRKINGAIQLCFIGIGGLITMFSGIAIWAYGRSCKQNAGDRIGSSLRLMRVIVFVVLMGGYGLGAYGAETQRCIPLKGVGTAHLPKRGSSLTDAESSREQSRADLFQLGGLLMIVSGLLVWHVGGGLLWLERRRLLMTAASTV